MGEKKFVNQNKIEPDRNERDISDKIIQNLKFLIHSKFIIKKTEIEGISTVPKRALFQTYERY